MSTTFNWSSPQNLSTTTVDSSDPQVVMDPNGNLVAVWIENGAIKSSSQLVGHSWTTSSTITHSGTSPCIVIDITGNATVIWVQSNIIHTSSKTLTGSWLPVNILSSSGASSPSLAVDSVGNLIATWVRNGTIESSIKYVGLIWQPATSIHSILASSPYVAIGGTGLDTKAVIVWHSTSTNLVYASTKFIFDGYWSSPRPISDRVHSSAYAQATVDGNSNVTAVWYSYDVYDNVYSNVNVQSSTQMQSNDKWTPFVSISPGGVSNPANLILNIGNDSNGNVLAVWNNSFDGATYNIQSAIKPVGSVWSPMTDIIDSLYSLTVNLTVIPLGDAFTSFMFYNGTSMLILTSEMYTNGFNDNSWSVPINISTGTGNGFPNIACALTGSNINACVVWTKFNGTHNVIQASTASRLSIVPPSNLTVTQNTNNMGVCVEYYNLLQWTASTDHNLAGYVIFRNGVFIGQTTKTTVQYIDHNQQMNGSVTYEIAAINSQQMQSNLLSTSFP